MIESWKTPHSRSMSGPGSRSRSTIRKAGRAKRAASLLTKRRACGTCESRGGSACGILVAVDDFGRSSRRGGERTRRTPGVRFRRRETHQSSRVRPRSMSLPRLPALSRPEIARIHTGGLRSRAAPKMKYSGESAERIIMRTILFFFFLAFALSACSSAKDEPLECVGPVRLQECAASTTAACTSPDGGAISDCDVFIGDRSAGAVPFHCVASCTGP